MILDSEEKFTYTVGDVGLFGSYSMIVFLSFPNGDARYRRVAQELRNRNLVVRTNFDNCGIADVERRTDLRLASIRSSDAYVFFASDKVSRLRELEFGYALGREIPVAYVGRPVNSLHRYGDVFLDIEDFVEWFYSDEYNRYATKWRANRTLRKAVA